MYAPLTFLDMFVNMFVRTLIPLVALATFCITTYLKIGRVIDMNAPLTFLDMFVNPPCRYGIFLLGP